MHPPLLLLFGHAQNASQLIHATSRMALGMDRTRGSAPWCASFRAACSRPDTPATAASTCPTRRSALAASCNSSAAVCVTFPSLPRRPKNVTRYFGSPRLASPGAGCAANRARCCLSFVLGPDDRLFASEPTWLVSHGKQVEPCPECEKTVSVLGAEAKHISCGRASGMSGGRGWRASSAAQSWAAQGSRLAS